MALRLVPNARMPVSPRDVEDEEAAPVAEATARSLTTPSRPGRPDARTSAQRTAAWMVDAHGRHAAAARARAAGPFYEGDASGQVYWRAPAIALIRLLHALALHDRCRGRRLARDWPAWSRLGRLRVPGRSRSHANLLPDIAVSRSMDWRYPCEAHAV